MVYSVAEVAALLDIAPWSVYELIKRDEVPGVLRLGSKIVFSRKIINGWLNKEAYAIEHGADGDSEP